jgi:hypothetical protein
MPLAHAAHQLLYAGPALLALVAVALLTWRSARRGPRPLAVLRQPTEARTRSNRPARRSAVGIQKNSRA